LPFFPEVSTSEQLANTDVVEGGGRLGLLAKGVSYVLVALLAVKVALGRGANPEDREGALQALGDESFGAVLLGLLAAGFAGYALWRFAQAFLDRDVEGAGPKGLAKRAGYLVKGLLYTGLCVVCVSILFGSGSEGRDEKQATARVLDVPLGRWLVAAVGTGFLISAGYNAFRAVTRKFEDDLHTGRLNRGERRIITVAGVTGHLARTVAFGLVGWFLIKAAWEYDPKEAIGLDGALSKLAAENYGPVLLGTTAAGLLAYGLFCFVQARYRQI
jgi:Domain of Unknown Function (DUF1206)